MMRITYEKSPEHHDNAVYAVTVKADEHGDYRLGPRQIKKLKAAGAWRFRRGSFNGPDLYVNLDSGEVAK